MVLVLYFHLTASKQKNSYNKKKDKKNTTDTVNKGCFTVGSFRHLFEIKREIIV